MSVLTAPATSSPVLAVCGWSGSGKTTLLESVIPELRSRGLAVAVLKHDAHGLDVDHAGKDSDRLFRAGAEVALYGPAEVLRRARPSGIDDLPAALAALLDHNDLVLVEGHKDTPLPKVWLASERGPDTPPGLTGCLAVLPWGEGRPARMLELLERWLPTAWRAVSLLGGILVGGGSARIGTPKHFLMHGGITFLETVATALRSSVPQVVLLGSGSIPGSCEHLPCLADPPALDGPLAGMLAALRWAPGCAWIFAACDLPRLAPAAVNWLVEQRTPGRWAVLPDCGRGVEPLLALYEPQARGLLEALAASGRRAPRLIAAHEKVAVVEPPTDLRECWRNINTPDDLVALENDRQR
jgi:molybdopterin-guanine dinucleotide biosynthesis protein A